MKTVLLIDDDPIANFINRKLLEKTDLVKNVQVASNGQQALDMLISIRRNADALPDLIILDINMPLLNGFQFLEQLYGLELNLQRSKIAILTSSDAQDDQTRARELGVAIYLVKPITIAILFDLLR